MRSPRSVAIVVAFNGGADLLRCVEALLASDYGDLSVLVVDNHSADNACAHVERLSAGRVRVLRLSCNCGFAGGVNRGAAFLRREGILEADDVIVLVNQDCVVRPDAVSALVTRLSTDSRIAVVGARLLDLDGCTLQHAGGLIAPNGLTRHLGRGQVDDQSFMRVADVEYVTGALLALRCSTWARIGPFDESYRPVYYEEVDFCVRARNAGLRIVYEPAAVATHAEAVSCGGGESSLFLGHYHRNRMRFLLRHRLGRGAWFATLRAELGWLLTQRSAAQVMPVLRAYAALPLDLLRLRRGIDRERL